MYAQKNWDQFTTFSSGLTSTLVIKMWRLALPIRSRKDSPGAPRLLPLWLPLLWRSREASIEGESPVSFSSSLQNSFCYCF